MTITAAADGSSLGNPGPTGWGWYIDDERWAAGGQARGTNNIGELSAVIDLLEQTRGEPRIHVLCDSKYVIDSVTKWMPGWKRKGWRKADGKPVLNVDLMQRIDTLMAERAPGAVTFEWVKGHAGHELNEAADRLANGAAAALQRGDVPDAGPGFGAAGTAQATAADYGDLLAALGEEYAGDDFEEATEAHLERLERSLLRNDTRSDASSVAALLHPQWQEIGASGRLWSREEMLAEIQPLASHVEMEVVSAEEVAPDTWLVVWRSVSERPALRSSLWVRSGERWLQRFHQGTPLG